MLRFQKNVQRWGREARCRTARRANSLGGLINIMKKKLGVKNKFKFYKGYKIAATPTFMKSMRKMGFDPYAEKLDEYPEEKLTFKDWIEENILWRIERWLEIPKDIQREIKYFIQRGRRGYSDRDTWGFDHYLAEIISGGTKHLSKHLSGYPSSPFSKEKYPFNSTKEWKAFLLKISKGFKNYNKEDWGSNKDRKELSESMIMFVKRFQNLWD